MANDTLVGNLTLTGLPDLACVKNINDLVQWIIDHTSVDFPGGIEQGVTVGPVEPTDPAVTGIWVRTDNAGVFQGIYVFSGGVWAQIDLGGCLLASTPSGTPLVCDAGVSKPLSGTDAGQVLTLINTGTGESEFQSRGCIGPSVLNGKVLICNSGVESTLEGTGYGDVVVLTNTVTGQAEYLKPDDNKVSGLPGTLDLGGTALVGTGSPTWTVLQDVVITNNSVYRNKNAGASIVCTMKGFWDDATPADNPAVAVSSILSISFDGGAYTELRRLSDIPADVGVDGLSIIDRQVCASLPFALALAPGGSTTLHTRLQVTLFSDDPTTTFTVTNTYISLLVTELSQ